MVGWSLLFYFIALLFSLSLAIALVAMALLRVTDFLSFFSLLMGLIIPSSLLTIVVIVLFLIGYVTLYNHRHEFGAPHQKSMERSFLLFIGVIVSIIAIQVVAFVMYFLAFASWFIMFGLGTATQPTLEEMQQALIPAIMTQQGLAIFLAFLVVVFLYYVVISLLPAADRVTLKAAMVMLVLGPALAFAILTYQYLTGQLFIPAFQEGVGLGIPVINFQLQDVLAGLAGTSMQAAGGFLFWRVFKIAFEAVRTGEIRPQSSDSVGP